MEAQRNVLPILFLAVILFLLQCVLPQRVAISSQIERRALLDLRSSLGLREKEWPIKADPCTSWLGVQCLNGTVRNIIVSGLRRTRLGRLSPRFNVDSLVNLTQLVSFNASGFPLPGSIPDLFGSQLAHLEVLDLRSCSVSGSIPASLGNSSRLASLYLGNNNIAGSIPLALGQLSNSKFLDLSGNSLTGSIPSSFGSLANIERLELASNYLSGSIPPGLGSLKGLEVFNVSDNNLSGSIPSQLSNLSRLLELDLSKNSLYGSLPEEFKMLKSLQKMVIEDNMLDGPLPIDLFSSLIQLQVVDLSGNKLDGVLHGTFWSMPNLRFFDVSSNNFTGPVPALSSNHTVSMAAVFNLSNNFLYGTLKFSLGRFKSIDITGNYFQDKVVDNSGRNATVDRNCLQALNQRSSDDCRLFYTERGLSFDNFGEGNKIRPRAAEARFESRKRWIFILAGVLGGICFIIILVLVLVLLLRRYDKGIRNQRGSGNIGPVPEGDSPQLPKDSTNVDGSGDPFTYEQLLQATGKFCGTNLINHGHSGDLFRGVLEGGIPVVIKKIDLSSFKKELYMTGMDLFRKLSHARFVPLLGHCLEHETDKLLVYKYMPNGDLANSFYRATNSDDDSLKSLDWITRLKVATGAAEGH
ncbi:putative LRR receptor-like serine/threonine-protein kinase [Hibiscus syriacus]|uniref:LRR receptor-like serine/threonine-protein kinase n=1 Tax=Hibiscus syriacus TaxID=106335 RepID=A0A6A3C4J7_HIBSY|nr:putative LRR receptor-like serine/threonine-protein kinase [Hibiscus syriacus]